MSNRPEWQLPKGVSKGSWEYAHSESIASDYDRFFSFNSLFEYDKKMISQCLADGSSDDVVADFGCGTGRSLLPVIQLGFQGVAIDFSDHMLKEVDRKAKELGVSVGLIKANLVEMDSIQTNAFDHGLCMFSTLGMIEGHSARQAALAEMQRVLKPGAKFVLHVHNYWYNLTDRGGRQIVFKDYLPKWLGGERNLARGDRYFHYRGISNMYLHIFSKSEMANLLTAAGFEKPTFTPLNSDRSGPLKAKWFMEKIRANGWLITCQSN